jgi:anti-sigma factor RsiW
MNLHTATLPSQKVIPAQLMPAHLTPAQLDALLSPNASARDAAAAEAHLLLCPACAAELDHLRDSISLFRQASSNHASRELNNLQPLSLPTRSLLFPALQPTHWFAVAATLLVALLPLQSFRARPIQSAEAYAVADTTESDAALLDDVDREVSASVPTSMQALADPTEGDSAALTLQAPTNAPDQTPNQTPVQGKD